MHRADGVQSQSYDGKWRRVGHWCGRFSLALWLTGCALQVPAPAAAPLSTDAALQARAPADSALQPPEAATGYRETPVVSAPHFMASSANPLATHAAYTILKAGGSAVDAAIAAQMVLTLVEPQSSGIGGGAFMLQFDGRQVHAYDGRETAPAQADTSLFLDADGKPMRFFDAVVGGRAVGVPGVLRMLEQAHRQHGRLPWASLFAPAITLAEDGFVVSPRLAALLADAGFLKRDPVAAGYFFDADGQPWRAGHLLKNPALAATLRAIAAGGAAAFYTGEIAAAVVSTVRNHPTNPGRLALADLAAYRAIERAPVCSTYRKWTVCGMPPPSSAGIAVAQILGMLEYRHLAALVPEAGQPAVEAVHLITEAERLAYADRAKYVADTDFVALPGGSPAALIDKTYLASRAALIGARSMGSALPGMPLGIRLARGTDRSPELPSTSHLSIVDAAGTAVAMTTSIETGFGAQLMVRGFLLNNQLTDFSFVAADADGPVANRLQPGKRPRSTMAPTLVLERASGRLVLAIGSPGGPAIITYVAKVLFGVLDWGLGVQAAISLPNFGSRNGATELEKNRFTPTFIGQLQERAHQIRLGAQTSGLQGVMLRPAGSGEVLTGGADPRREGSAEGD